jgi:enoyl-CoA hydratase/carnithine racemase
MTSRFRGKVVIQTAGTGIGAATARRFHAKGAAVVLSGRRSFSTIPKGNQINFTMREELFDAFERIAASTVRAVVMSEEGCDFCAGVNLRRRRAGEDRIISRQRRKHRARERYRFRHTRTRTRRRLEAFRPVG